MLRNHPETNPVRLKDPIAQRFSDMWFEQHDTLTDDQQDQIGKAYLRHVVGINEATMDKFLRYDAQAHRLVGLRQAKVIDLKNDHLSFWKEVAEVTPGVYSIGDIQWLSAEEKEPFYGDYHFLMQLSHPWEHNTGVIGLIHMNALNYK